MRSARPWQGRGIVDRNAGTPTPEDTPAGEADAAEPPDAAAHPDAPPGVAEPAGPGTTEDDHGTPDTPAATTPAGATPPPAAAAEPTDDAAPTATTPPHAPPTPPSAADPGTATPSPTAPDTAEPPAAPAASTPPAAPAGSAPTPPAAPTGGAPTAPTAAGAPTPPAALPATGPPASGGGGEHDWPRVLGGAAAAEGRTTGPTQRIGGHATGIRPGAPGTAHPGTHGHPEPHPHPHPQPHTHGHPHGHGPAAGAATAAGANGGRHFIVGGRGDGTGRRPPWFYLAIGVPLALLVVLVMTWAVDTAALGGQVMRNVELGDKPVGGLGEASLPGVLDGLDKSLVDRPVAVTTGDKTYRTTAGDLGLTLDEDATTKAALDAGRGDALLLRPFRWATSFFHHRKVELRYAVKQSQVEATMLALQGNDLTAGKPPTIQRGPDGWTAVAGVPGKGVDVDRVVDRLPRAAAEAPDGTIVVRTRTIPVTPGYSDDDARKLAERANQMTAHGLALTAGGATVNVAPATLRSWIGPVAAQDHLDLAIDTDAVRRALPDLFGRITSRPVDAGVTLQNGVPTVTPSRPGVRCCGADSSEVVWKALIRGQPSAKIKTQVVQPRITTKTAKSLGIKQPVGGNHAWRDGAATTAGPGFTTYYQAGQPRVTNIHRIADLVRGAIILPGETFSINERVGERTTGKGFVEAGAIREGEHVDEVGGGVSQFATTTFNAAYFAGLDITSYQAHSEYFTRYPRGREATMGYPAPDLKIRNNTPYGILVWTSYTGDSVTVTLYSSPYATADQTGITESPSGACTVVQTTRTRTYPDGHKDTDTFKATYRPGEGQRC